MGVLTSLFKRASSDFFFEGNADTPTVILVDIDPSFQRLQDVFVSLNVSVLTLSLSELFPKSGVYNNGLTSVRSKLYERLMDFNSHTFRLVVSTDIETRVREVVDVANRLSIKTYLLNFESVDEGKQHYRNFREGYDYPIVDIALFLDPELANEVIGRKKGISEIQPVCQKDKPSNNHSAYNSYIATGSNHVVFIEEVPKDYVNWIASYSKNLQYKIFARQDILKKDERDKLKDSISFVAPGSRYEKIKRSSNAVFHKVEDGFVFSTHASSKSLENLDDYLLCLLDLNTRKLAKDNSIDGYTLDKTILLRELKKEYTKKEYKTLVLNVKRGDNLFGSLKHYPKMLGCQNHIIYRGDKVEGDVFASFGLPSEKDQQALLALASKDGVVRPYYNIENGFLSFTGIALIGAAASHSILLDEKSLYFNGVDGSSVEDNILFGKKPAQKDIDAAKDLISRITTNNLSKYNHAPIGLPSLPGSNDKKVLIVDQRYADKSIGYASADESTFQKMLLDACKENPDADIIIKVHPDALTGLVKGHFDRGSENLPNVYLYGEDINPLCLLRSVDSVYAVSSQMGFEALMMGLPLKLYGQAIYGGWGLTDDRCEFQRRGGEKRSLEELFYWLYMHNTPYVGPISEEVVGIDEFIDQLMVSRGETSPGLKPLNVGDGEFVFNSITSKYSLIKAGKIGLGTLLNLLREVSNPAIHQQIIMDLDEQSLLPEKNPLLDLLLSYYKQEIAFEEYKNTLFEYSRLNDLSKFIVVFSYQFESQDLEKLIKIICSKSTSESLINRVLYWGFGHFSKIGVDTNNLSTLLNETNSISEESKKEYMSLYGSVEA
jgi:hypothetical protein